VRGLDTESICVLQVMHNLSGLTYKKNWARHNAQAAKLLTKSMATTQEQSANSEGDLPQNRWN